MSITTGHGYSREMSAQSPPRKFVLPPPPPPRRRHRCHRRVPYIINQGSLGGTRASIWAVLPPPPPPPAGQSQGGEAIRPECAFSALLGMIVRRLYNTTSGVSEWSRPSHIIHPCRTICGPMGPMGSHAVPCGSARGPLRSALSLIWLSSPPPPPLAAMRVV